MLKTIGVTQLPIVLAFSCSLSLIFGAVLDKTVVKAHRLFKIVNGNPLI